MKKIVATISALALIFACCVPCAFATSSQNSTPELFTELCDSFFSQSEGYYVIDQSGRDISNSFYQSYIADYQQNRLDLIWDAFAEFGYCFNWNREEHITQLTRASVVTASVSDQWYEVIQSNNKPQGDWGVGYTLEGIYLINETLNRIEEVEAFNFDLVGIEGGGAYFDFEIYDESTRSAISSSRTSVSFVASYSVRMSWDGPYQSPWTETRTLGPKMITGYI